MSVTLPEVLVMEDGQIYVWMTREQREPIVMSQREWAGLTLAVDQELVLRQMDLSERRQHERETGAEPQLEPDYIDRVVACQAGRDEAAGYQLMFGDMAPGKQIQAVYDCPHPDSERWDAGNGHGGCSGCGLDWGYSPSAGREVEIPEATMCDREGHLWEYGKLGEFCLDCGEPRAEHDVA